MQQRSGILSSIFPYSCFTNSSVLLSQRLCTVFRHGKMNFNCSYDLPVQLHQEYVKTCCTDVVLFPVLWVGVLQVCSLVFIYWTSGPLALGRLLGQTDDSAVVTFCTKLTRPADHMPTLSQQLHKLCPRVEQPFSREIPLLGYVHVGTTSASGWQISNLSLCHAITPSY